jgi:hypothetical protein
VRRGQNRPARRQAVDFVGNSQGISLHFLGKSLEKFGFSLEELGKTLEILGKVWPPAAAENRHANP